MFLFPLVFCSLANAAHRYAVIHVVADPGWAVVTVCDRQFPGNQPKDPETHTLVYDYTVFVGVGEGGADCKHVYVAQYPQSPEEPPIKAWMRYMSKRCGEIQAAAGIPGAGDEQGSDCNLEYIDLYTEEIDVDTLQADGDGRKTVTLEHGSVILYEKTLSAAKTMRILNGGLMQIGSYLNLGQDVYSAIGAPKLR